MAIYGLTSDWFGNDSGPLRHAPSNAELAAIWDSPAGNDAAIAASAWAPGAGETRKQYASDWLHGPSSEDSQVFNDEHNRDW
jgi:hypothetical protein